MTAQPNKIVMPAAFQRGKQTISPAITWNLSNQQLRYDQLFELDFTVPSRCRKISKSEAVSSNNGGCHQQL